jgi:hypothetical protein
MYVAVFRKQVRVSIFQKFATEPSPTITHIHFNEKMQQCYILNIQSVKCKKFHYAYYRYHYLCFPMSYAIELCFFLNEFNLTFLAWKTGESNRTTLQLHTFQDLKNLRNSCETTLQEINNLGPNFDPAIAIGDFKHVNVNATRTLFPPRNLTVTLRFHLCDYMQSFLVRVDFYTRWKMKLQLCQHPYSVTTN